ncbi:MAG: rhomboid family intramembrane serine protease [Bacteroidota bacterium]|nr:rhomboid family intramembrane serine protease [Bacteroidota bacterium]
MTFGHNPYSQLTFTDRWKGFRRQYPVLAFLIAINTLVWLGITMVSVLFWLSSKTGGNESALFKQLVGYLSIPASINQLLLQPWSILTYMFLHVDFFHILFNMLWLFWFGKIFLDYLNGRQLLWVYLLGGLAGGISFVVAYNIFPVFEISITHAYALGASASIMAIMAAIASLIPNYTLYLLFIGKVKLKHIAIFTVILDFLLIKSDNPGGHIAHIGGMVWGLLYTLFYLKQQNKSGVVGSMAQRFHHLFGLRRRPKLKVSHSNHPLSDEEYNKNRKNQQDQIDKILEKISKSGYSSLTREEKDLLFRSSNQNPKH